MTVGDDWKPGEVGPQLGVDFSVGSTAADPEVRKSWLERTTGALVAWDPVARKARGTVSYPGPTNGGTLATAGHLVFQGTAGGEFRAYAADTGRRLWSFPAQTGIVAGPITDSVGGTQYVAVLAGWGGVWDLFAGVLAPKSGRVRNVSRTLVFKLDGTATLPPLGPLPPRVLDPPPSLRTPGQIEEGASWVAAWRSDDRLGDRLRGTIGFDQDILKSLPESNQTVLLPSAIGALVRLERIRRRQGQGTASSRATS